MVSACVCCCDMPCSKFRRRLPKESRYSAVRLPASFCFLLKARCCLILQTVGSTRLMSVLGIFSVPRYPLSGWPCRFSSMLSSQVFMPGIRDVRSILCLSIAAEIAAFCSSSLFASICAAKSIRDVKAVIAISTIGSLQPDMPTPLSSEDSSFFIQASGAMVVCVNVLVIPVLGQEVTSVVHHLLFDISFLGNLCQIGCRIHLAFRPVAVYVCHSEMQMLAGCSASRIAGSTVRCPAFTLSPAFTVMSLRCM